MFFSQNRFDGGELADDTANSPQAVHVSATLIALDVDQCAIEIVPRILLSRIVRQPKGLFDALDAFLCH